MIDFHYSDKWADPGQQDPPTAWQSHTLAQLITDVYSHTQGILKYLKDNGITVDWVQVGDLGAKLLENPETNKNPKYNLLTSRQITTTLLSGSREFFNFRKFIIFLKNNAIFFKKNLKTKKAKKSDPFFCIFSHFKYLAMQVFNYFKCNLYKNITLFGGMKSTSQKTYLYLKIKL